MAHVELSVSMFPMDTFPRYHYTRDRVEIILARFQHLGFEAVHLPRSEYISISELKNGGSASHFLISNWMGKEKEMLMSDCTDIKLESNKSTSVVSIVYDKKDMPEECIYGVILDTGQHLKSDTKESHVINSSIKELQTNVDSLLERYVLSFVKDIIENVLSHSNSGTTEVYEQNGVKRTLSSIEYGKCQSSKRLKINYGAYGSRKDALERLMSAVMAVYNRSGAPREEWPDLETQGTHIINDSVSQELPKVDASLIGFGYEHDILQLFVDRNENAEVDNALRDLLAKNKIERHRINYGPWKRTPLCDIRVGHNIVANGRSGTLGGFARKDDDNTSIYALTARHVVEDADYVERFTAQGNVDAQRNTDEPALQLTDRVLYNRSQGNNDAFGLGTTVARSNVDETARQEPVVSEDNGHSVLAESNVEAASIDVLRYRLSKFAIVEKGNLTGKLDIASAKIIQPSEIRDTRFKNSRGAFKNSMLFDFRGTDDHEIGKLLQGEQIHAWTSANLPRKAQITIPIYKDVHMNQTFLVIENEFCASDSQSDQDSLPDPYAFGKGDSGAIICSDDICDKGVHVYSMFTHKLVKDNERTLFLTLRLQEGLEQLSNYQVPRARSRYTLC